MPYALIFDVDGVLANTEPLSARASTAAFRELCGIDVPLTDHLAYTGATPHAHARGITHDYGLDIDPEDVVRAHQRGFLAELKQSEDLAFPGVHALIDRVSRSDEWDLGLATGSSRIRSEATLKAIGLDPALFRTWITGDDIQNPKPDPETYRAAASELSVFPRQCVVIEDSIAGVQAAKAASMRCVALTNTFPGEHLHQADRIVDSLADINLTFLYDLVTDG